jgi:glycosyltransferase involved in cell wall biosynthesis
VRTVKEQAFDLVHSHTRVTQVMSEAVFRLTGTPYVTTCHGFFKHRRLSRRFLPCWGEKVIAISESVKDHLVRDMKVPEEKVEMVYNGIDLDRYGNVTEEVRGNVLGEIGIDEGNVVVGTVGRFSSVKGFKYLVEAFDKAAAGIKNISLLVVGQGPEESDLLKRAAKSRFSGRMFFISGKRPLAEYLAAMDIFCMPSLNEGFGLAVAEAMASGKPCIVSDVGGLTEIVTDGKNGLVVKPASGEELARAIVRLHGDPDLMRNLSREAVIRSRDFSLEKSVAGTIRVYESVLGSP